MVVPGAAHFSKIQEVDTLIGIKEIEKADRITKPSSPRLPMLTSNRGLLSPNSRQERISNVGPGAYEV